LTAKFRNTETFRIRHSLQNDLCTFALLFVCLNRGGDVALNNIIAQHYTNWLLGGKVFNERERFGDAALAFLICIV